MTNAKPPLTREDPLDHLGPLIDEAVTLPLSRRSCRVVRPGDTDLLIDRSAGDPEQNLPYWAEIWPSGIALADTIALNPELVRGSRAFEIGCGLGITAIAALEAGADLLVSDYSAESLRLCRENARRNVGISPPTLQFNWRSPEAALVALGEERFSVLLAADVLYEARDVDPLLALVEHLMAPTGLFLLAEPGRAVARRFLDAAREAGWASTSRTHIGPWPDPKDAEVEVNVHRLMRQDVPR